jgi:hypothetical protein
MSKKIVIASCLSCPSRDHRGAFGHISYIPVCRRTGKDLPYTVGASAGMTLVASPTYAIPDFCPLEDDNAHTS